MASAKRQSQAVELYGAGIRPSFWVVCVVISLFIHLAVLGAIVFSPWSGAEAEWTRSGDTINVDLVSFNPEVPAPPGESDSGGGTEDAASAEADRIDADGDDSEASVSEDQDSDAGAISVKKGVKKNISKDYDLKTPAPGVKTSMKKKTLDSEKVIADAVSRMEQEAEKQRPGSVQERIASLQKEVGDEDYRDRIRERAGGSSGGAEAEDLSPLEIYQAEVAVTMKQNWAFSPDMAGEDARGLEARLVIKIMSDGEIADVWFEKRSGNAYLDESAYRTVMKASPLPSLPEGRSQYHLVLGFTPSGLTQ